MSYFPRYAVRPGDLRREKAIVLLMIEGKCGAAIVRTLKATAFAIQNSKRHVGSKILEFMGNDILVQIQRKPGWENDLDATRERLACRVERRQ